jgi:hypothetical protein
MSCQSPVVFAAAEMLNVQLGRRVADDLAENAVALKHRLANLKPFRTLVKQDAAELNGSAHLTFAKIDLHYIAFTHAILPGTVFEHCIHRSAPPGSSKFAKRDDSN